MSSTPANYLNKFQFVDMKQQNRFVLSIDVETAQGKILLPSYYVRVSGLPSIDNNPVTVDTINSEYKIKGKSRWQNISVTLYDPIAGEDTQTNGANAAWKWINDFHHNSKFDKDGFMDDYKRDIALTYITPWGGESDSWVLHGAFCASVNWGDMDVSSDDLVLIELDISYDWAEYEFKRGVGATQIKEGGNSRTIPGNTDGFTGMGGSS